MKKTKTVLVSIIMLLTLLVFVQACEKSATRSLIGTLTLTNKQTHTAIYQGKSISITASDFKDSRCPINAQCIWQGYASVKLTFKDDVKEQELILCTGGCTLLSIPLPEAVILNGKTVKIKLEDITPYPTLAQTVQEPSKVKISFSE